MSTELRFAINLLPDLSVVTKDGEVIGTWDTDETDAFYQFTPDGAASYLFEDLFIGPLCQKIERWLIERDRRGGLGAHLY